MHLIAYFHFVVAGEIVLNGPDRVNCEPYKHNIFLRYEANCVKALIVRDITELPLRRVHLLEPHKTFGPAVPSL